MTDWIYALLTASSIIGAEVVTILIVRRRQLRALRDGTIAGAAHMFNALAPLLHGAGVPKEAVIKAIRGDPRLRRPGVPAPTGRQVPRRAVAATLTLIAALPWLASR